MPGFAPKRDRQLPNINPLKYQRSNYNPGTIAQVSVVSNLEYGIFSAGFAARGRDKTSARRVSNSYVGHHENDQRARILSRSGLREKLAAGAVFGGDGQ